jgi:2-amino-4-hydroxy-6-hydroxymethyldihydropteridine diphosphokinase
LERVIIGFGSNQGESMHICRKAIETLGIRPKIEVVRVSSFYRTKPVGPIEQQWFINGVVECLTELEPEELLKMLMGIEADFGRIRSSKWGPRTLDLDILFYGDRLISLPHLEVPHPRIQERLFVLMPLAEIAPSLVHPGCGSSVQDLLTHFLRSQHDQQVERMENS